MSTQLIIPTEVHALAKKVERLYRAAGNRVAPAAISFIEEELGLLADDLNELLAGLSGVGVAAATLRKEGDEESADCLGLLIGRFAQHFTPLVHHAEAALQDDAERVANDYGRLTGVSSVSPKTAPSFGAEGAGLQLKDLMPNPATRR